MTSEIAPALREKVRTHPCYSEEAHHHYARMHAAVAPACNIQCNFCNRKYDCVNE
jgi:nitrogen fixation protein NifB